MNLDAGCAAFVKKGSRPYDGRQEADRGNPREID